MRGGVSQIRSRRPDRVGGCGRFPDLGRFLGARPSDPRAEPVSRPLGTSAISPTVPVRGTDGRSEQKGLHVRCPSFVSVPSQGSSLFTVVSPRRTCRPSLVYGSAHPSSRLSSQQPTLGPSTALAPDPIPPVASTTHSHALPPSSHQDGPPPVNASWILALALYPVSVFIAGPAVMLIPIRPIGILGYHDLGQMRRPR